jgi:hypothetical protein
MKKYHWLSDDGWQGPQHFQEILKMGLDENTPIWYPELCENGKETPGECDHDKETIRSVKKALSKKICRYIIFTKTPLKGKYRYKNEFQIYPADFENMPKNADAAHFPSVLEFKVDATELHAIPEEMSFFDERWGMSETTNEINRMKKLCSLLTAFTNNRFFTYEEKDGKWVIPLDKTIPSEELDGQSSRWAFGLFYYPGISDDMKTSSYSNPSDDPIQVKPDHLKYYTHDPFDTPRGEISFPHTLTKTFDRYFELNQRAQKVADSSAYLICNGIDLLNNMKSLSFLSFISSIETIVNHEYTDKNKGIEFECAECKTIRSSPYTCQTCGRPHWGISAKFRNFLSEYLSSTEGSVQKYKKIYSLRSKLVHSGALLLNDSQIDWAQFNGPNDHWMILRETMQLSRLALVNWLLKEKAKPKEPSIK